VITSKWLQWVTKGVHVVLLQYLCNYTGQISKEQHSYFCSYRGKSWGTSPSEYHTGGWHINLNYVLGRDYCFITEDIWIQPLWMKLLNPSKYSICSLLVWSQLQFLDGQCPTNHILNNIYNTLQKNCEICPTISLPSKENLTKSATNTFPTGRETIGEWYLESSIHRRPQQISLRTDIPGDIIYINSTLIHEPNTYLIQSSGSVGYLAKDVAISGFPMHLLRICFTELA